MKKIGLILLTILVFSIFLNSIFAQNNKKSENKGTKEVYQLESKNLEDEAKDLDNQIAELNRNIENVVSKYKLMELKNVRVLPYQVSYDLEKDYIQIERHIFVRNENGTEIIGVNTKSMKIYVSGNKVSKIESVINERNYDASNSNSVIVVDPSPSTADNNDISFTQKVNRFFKEKDKKLGSIKNTTAFPVRNDIKREFYIPHLTYFYNTLVNISETYYKKIKDSEQGMTEFLRRSTLY